MTIETKYNIGDKVWVEILGEPCLAKIGAMYITTNGNMIWYGYDVYAKEGHVINAKELFPTKEELLKSL